MKKFLSVIEMLNLIMQNGKIMLSEDIKFVSYCFSFQLQDYSNFPSAIMALLRLILGDFDYPSMAAANRTLGPLYFITYVFFVFFVLLVFILDLDVNLYYEDLKNGDLKSRSRKRDHSTLYNHDHPTIPTPSHPTPPYPHTPPNTPTHPTPHL